MPLAVFIARRVAVLIPTLFFVSVLIFSLQRLLPGDAAIALAGEESDPAVLECRQRYCRDPEGEPEVAFVNPAAENVYARPARVALETDHPD